MCGDLTLYEQERERTDAAEKKLHALWLLHSPSRFDNPCCMVCSHSEGWPCRTRQEIDRKGP